MTATSRELSARAQRMAGLLANWPRQRVQLAGLWELLDAVDPASRMDVRRRRILSELIAELANAQVVDLPAARSYDHAENPPLPRFLVIRREPAVLPPRKPAVWHPALAWAPGAGLTRAQEDTLGQVNQWLHQNRDRLIVPSRERSLEVFGDEKALDRLAGSALFAPGRLTLELLRCRRVVPRLHCETAGDGHVLLVVENSDTFDSVLSALRNRDDHRIGLVGWGAGTGFEASVLSVPLAGRAITEIRYFGDLDENGLRIPANASVVAQAEGLPAVAPAAGLYDALLQADARQEGQRRLPPGTAGKLVDWLSPSQRAAAASLLTEGVRIAQEAVGLSYLTAYDSWLFDIWK